MVKVHTIEMLEHSAKNFPNVKAHADMINGAIVGMGNGVTVAPATGKPLYVVINQQVGDKEYEEEYPLAKDTYVNLFDLAAWVDKELDVTEANIAYGVSESYANLTVGTELTFDASTFKFKKGTASSGDVNFVVTKRFGNLVNGVTVKIGVKA